METLAKPFLILYRCAFLFAWDSAWVKRMQNVGQFLFKVQQSCKTHGPFWLSALEQPPGGFKIYPYVFVPSIVNLPNRASSKTLSTIIT